jgi:hypothetical protein
MILRGAVAMMLMIVFAGAFPAAAQFPPPPGQAAAPGGASPFPPPPGQASPFPPPSGQARPTQGPASPFPPPGATLRNPCEAFIPLRQDAEKNAAAIQAAGQRKASREEVCPLFRNFAAAEAKMVKFLETNQTMCGVPPDAVKQAKSTHARTIQTRNQICSAGAAPRGPSLSDAFGGPALPDAPKPGRGTFDTLTGSPLGR